MRSADIEFFRYFPSSERDRQWGVFLSGAGVSHIPPFWPEYPKQIHPDGYMFRWDQGRVLHEYQAVYIPRGSGVFESASAGTHPLKPGSLILLFPGEWHRYRPDQSTGWDEYWVGFAGSYVDQLVRDGFFSPADPPWEVGADNSLLPIYRELLDLTQAEPIGFQQLAAADVIKILAAGLAAVRRERSSESDEHRVRQAKAYLEEHVDGTVSIPQLAATLRISSRHLSRLFRSHTGMSPHEFYLQVKMRRVQQLLATKLSIKEIASQMRFESQFHLSRAFKTRFGMAPSQWRRTIQGPPTT